MICDHRECVLFIGCEVVHGNVLERHDREIHVHAGDVVWESLRECRGDHGTPITPLRAIALVAQSAHEFAPGARGVLDAPAGAGRPITEPVPGERRNDDVECVAGVGRVGEPIDHVEELDDRSGPTMGEHERQRIRVRRPDVDEVNAQPVDDGAELREPVQSLLRSCEVVARAVTSPVAAVPAALTG